MLPRIVGVNPASSSSSAPGPRAGAVLNISGYRFVEIDEPEALRDRLQTAAAAAALRGTILIAHEGLNLSLAGAPAPLRRFVDALRADARFASLDIKESWSDTLPFARLKVKCKREIIRMDRPAIRPQAGRAPSVSPDTLARWLDRGCDDEGRPLALLDTRNAFEVNAGRFEGALDWRLARFGDFPDAFAAARASLAGKTVVSYCTGGIRCEKAALLMRAEGFGPVLQLEGGILRYLEQQGTRHWQGRCVVFDERGSLDARLAPPPAASVP